MEKQNVYKSTSVATINGQKILVIQNGEKRVAIKPICQALGVAYQPQMERLKNDPVLSSTVTLSMTVGADGKTREMATIPFRYIFGWLFRIDSRNVKEEAREAVLTYQKQCYDVLYDYFAGFENFYHEKERWIEEQKEIYSRARRNFANAKSVMKDAYSELEEAIDLTYEDYKARKAQTKMNFDELNEKGGE